MAQQRRQRETVFIIARLFVYFCPLIVPFSRCSHARSCRAIDRYRTAREGGGEESSISRLPFMNMTDGQEREGPEGEEDVDGDLPGRAGSRAPVGRRERTEPVVEGPRAEGLLAVRPDRGAARRPRCLPGRAGDGGRHVTLGLRRDPPDLADPGGLYRRKNTAGPYLSGLSGEGWQRGRARRRPPERPPPRRQTWSPCEFCRHAFRPRAVSEPRFLQYSRDVSADQPSPAE